MYSVFEWNKVAMKNETNLHSVIEEEEEVNSELKDECNKKRRENKKKRRRCGCEILLAILIKKFEFETIRFKCLDFFEICWKK